MKKILFILAMSFAFFMQSFVASAYLIDYSDVIEPAGEAYFTNYDYGSEIDGDYEYDFSDVGNMTYYSGAIDWMYENGVVEGYEDGTFRPDDCVNRAEFLKVLYEVLELDVEDYDDAAVNFSDVKEDDWYYDYVRAAVMRSSINGYEDGTFRANQCVSRVEALKIAAVEFMGDDFDQDMSGMYYGYFDDIDEDKWYYDYFVYMSDFGVVPISHLDGDGYGPLEGMSRKEALELLYRLKIVEDNDLYYYSAYFEPFDIGAVPFYESCNYENGEFEDLDMLSFLPEDIDYFISLNLDSENKEDWSSFVDSLEDISKIDFVEEFHIEELESFLDKELVGVFGMRDYEDYYLALQLDEDGEILSYIENEFWMNNKSNVMCENVDDGVLWTVYDGDYFVWIYGDYFFMTNKEELREEGIENYFKGAGFDYDLDNGALASLMIDYSVLTDFMEDEMALYMDEMAPVLDIVDEFTLLDMQLFADGEGLVMDFDFEMEEDSSIFASYESKELSLINRVPDKDVMLYVEDVALEQVYDYLDLLGAFEGFETDMGLYEGLFCGPYAIAVLDSGDEMPNIILMSDVETCDAEAEAEGFFDYIVSEFESDLGFAPVNVNRGFSKIVFEADFLADVMYLDADTLRDKYELYYGVDDGVMVMALYNDFLEDYRRSSFENNDLYEEAVEDLGEYYGAAVTYLDIEVLLEYLSTIDVYGEFEEAMSYIDDFDYLVSSTNVYRGDLISRLILSVKK